jgi:hypothetical protein
MLTKHCCRQLNLYGFIKQKSGPLQGYYTHPCFCRGDKPLLALIGRNKGAVQPPAHHQTGSRTGPAAKRARSTRNTLRRSYAAAAADSSSDEQQQEQKAPVPQPVPQQQSLPVGIFTDEDDFVCLDRVALPMLFATMMAQTRVHPPGHACTLLPPSPTVLHTGCYSFQAFSSA